MRDAIVERAVSRVHGSARLGPDEQVDDKAMVFAPTALHRTDPFLLLSEDWFSSPGFEWHPHRGLETVTLVVDGVLEHGDSLGHAGALEAGDVQWMTAGRGIIHRELAYRDEHAHTLQLWLNLPARDKLAPTRYQDLRVADQVALVSPGVTTRVISGGVDGVTGPAANHWPVLGLSLALDPGVAHRVRLPARDRAFLHVLTGQLVVAGRVVSAGETAWSDPVGRGDGVSELALRTPDGDARSTALLFAAPPINEPVVFGGPFVMTTEAEIRQAFADLQGGAFGTIPRQARLTTR